MRVKYIEDLLISHPNEETKEILKDIYDEYQGEKPNQIKYFIDLSFNNKEYLNFKDVDSERVRIKNEITSTSHKEIILNAPTSFGKSYMIRSIASETPGNTLIVTPTLALANEYFIEFKKRFPKHDVCMDPFTYNSKFTILTPEKTTSLDENKIQYDYVIFDEFYEMYSSARTPIFLEALDLVRGNAKKIVFITPSNSELNVRGKKLGDVVVSTESSLTTRKLHYYINPTKQSDTKMYITSENPDTHPFPITTFRGKYEFINGVEDCIVEEKKTLILAQKSRMYEITSEIMEINRDHKIDLDSSPIILEIIEFLKNESPDTLLEKSIIKGIAYHNGSMDKFLRMLIEKAFEQGELSILIANTTLTKGVNINPDVMIINSFTTVRDPSKIAKKIFKIEDKNAIGRVGRSGEKANRLGLVMVFASRMDSERVKRSLANKDSEKLILSEEKIEKPISIKSYEDYYKSMYSERTTAEIKSGKFLTEGLDVNKIITYLNKRNINNAVPMCEEIAKKFLGHNIEKSRNPKGMLKAISHNMANNLLNMGYSIVYKYLKNRKDLYINNQSVRFESADNLWKFSDKSGDNDRLLAFVIKRYEVEYGFYFKQIFRFILLQLKHNKLINDNIIDKYESSIKEEESIGTDMQWPSPFVTYYLKNKTEKRKEHLNIVNNLLIYGKK